MATVRVVVRGVRVGVRGRFGVGGGGLGAPGRGRQGRCCCYCCCDARPRRILQAAVLAPVAGRATGDDVHAPRAAGAVHDGVDASGRAAFGTNVMMWARGDVEVAATG